MIRIVLAFLFTAFFLLPSTFACAQDESAAAPIGTIAAMEGEVVIGAANTPDPVTPQIGQPVYLNDIIETGAESRALVLFIDETEISIGENSKLTVDEYVYDPDDSAVNKARYSPLRGAFIYTSGLIAKREKPDVKIETTYGSIGIRGTIVWGGELDNEYNVFVQEGEATFATERGRVTVGPGQGTKVASKRAIPSRAKDWGQPKIERAVKTIALRNPELVRENVGKLKARHAEMQQRHLESIGRRKIERRENIEQHQEQIQEHREDMPKDMPKDIPEDMMEKRGEIMEKRQEMLQEKRAAETVPAHPIEKKQINEIREKRQQNLRGPDNARDFEKREKQHLQDGQTR